MMEHTCHKAALQARIDLPQGGQGFGAAGTGKHDVHHGHEQVQNNQINRRSPAQDSQGFLAVGGCEHIEAGVFGSPGKSLACDFTVVHDEKVLTGCRWSRLHEPSFDTVVLDSMSSS